MSKYYGELEINGISVSFNAEYSISGQYHPETLTSPEEYPEIEISELYILDNLDAKVLLNDEKVYESIVEMITEDFEE